MKGQQEQENKVNKKRKKIFRCSYTSGGASGRSWGRAGGSFTAGLKGDMNEMMFERGKKKVKKAGRER